MKNQWVGYVQRTYQQIKEQVLTNMGTQIPEMTDHTENNPFVKFVSIFSGLTEHINYYIDNTAREVHLPTARTYKSAVEIAKLFNYRLRGVIPATSEVLFSYSGSNLTDSIIIPIGTIVATEDNIQYVTTRAGVITISSPSIVLPVSQMIWQENFIGATTGELNQSFELPEGVADKYISMSIGAISYDFKETLAYSSAEDTHFTYKLNNEGKMIVSVGDGVQGKLPLSGQNVTIKYALSEGSRGNVAIGSINRIVSAGFTEVSVSNVVRASGGADIETLEDLKQRIPLHNRTLNRAVTDQDFIDLALLVSGVDASGVKFNCGRQVDLYVVPSGGGVATQDLLTSVEEYFEKKVMSPLYVHTISAGQLLITLEADVRVLPSFSNALTELNIRERLKTYFNKTLRTIPSSLHIGDIYEQMETTEGVDYSKVIQVTIKPYARIVVGDRALVWDIRVGNATEEVIWDLLYSSNNEFELLRNGEYSGTYLAGEQYQLEEIQFTIAEGGYVAGDRWEFHTYPSGVDMVVTEPSVFVLDDENLILNVTGGV